MSAEDIEIETIPGLPADLPAGERVLWQGRPEWKALARHTFKIRLVAGYFALMFAWRFVVAIREQQGVAGAIHLLIFAGLAGICLGVLALMAWINARATIYTITTRRVVLRIGVALPMSWNLPFKQLAAANLLERKEGDGDISLELAPPSKIAWLHLWPHVQPWHLVRPRPTLRAIAEPARVAAILGDAVKQWGASRAAAPLVAPAKADSPESMVLVGWPSNVVIEESA